MAARAISSGTISFGLVSIPVKVYVATSSEAVRMNQLHDTCGSRIKQQLFCPVCEQVLGRADLVKGYEYAKGQYVRFTDEELKALEAEKSQSLEIVEFVPLSSIDLVQIEKSYYVGPDKGGEKAYRLLSDAMDRAGQVAVGRYRQRGKEQLVLIRPYRKGLLLHYVYYADEVRSFDDIDVGGDVRYREGEMDLAEQLIQQLSVQTFDAGKFRDEWRDRVMQAVEEKVAGHEITSSPEMPAAQVIDLFEALKESLGARGPKKAAPPMADESEPKSKPRAKGAPKKAISRKAGGKHKGKSSAG